jgi:hypothetical protein
VARGTEAVYGTLPPRSPTLTRPSGDAQAIEARELIKLARADATTSRPTLRLSSVARPIYLSLTDPQLSFVESEKPTPLFARDYSYSAHRSIVPPQTPTN